MLFQLKSNEPFVQFKISKLKIFTVPYNHRKQKMCTLGYVTETKSDKKQSM